MSTPFSFSLPAFIQDFPLDSYQDAELKLRWDINVNGWITQAMPASPSFFYNPQTTDIPAGTAAVPVQWNAFPGRLMQYFSGTPPVSPLNPYNLSQDQVFQLADTGYFAQGGDKVSFPNIPSVICPEADWSQPLKTFGPYGPRGWLDEYCEWATHRDDNGNLIRIDFACENPEYWNTLWKVSPERVAELYQEILNWDAPAEYQVQVSLDDLVLYSGGQPVIDPETGGPVYNPLNKWNSGPIEVRTGGTANFSGGAIHLTSTPNTLQTELGLAGAATVQYNCGNQDSQQLICCAEYGQEYRNSDPNIGQSVNVTVGGVRPGEAPGTPNNLVCLANPVGLYIQPLLTPALFQFGPGIDPTKLPSGAAAADVWQVVRGSLTVVDPVTGQDFPGAMVLHAVVQIPASWLAVYPNMTLADITVRGAPIQYAGQVASQFHICLFARPLPAPNSPGANPCVSGALIPGQPLQSMMFTSVWNAYYNANEVAPTGQNMSLASNTTFIAPQVLPGASNLELTLTCITPSGTPSIAVLLPDGSAPDPNITVELVGTGPAYYAVPGNSFPPTNPNAYTALNLLVSVSAVAMPGLRGVTITDPSSGANTLPAALYIRA